MNHCVLESHQRALLAEVSGVQRLDPAPPRGAVGPGHEPQRHRRVPGERHLPRRDQMDPAPCAVHSSQHDTPLTETVVSRAAVDGGAHAERRRQFRPRAVDQRPTRVEVVPQRGQVHGDDVNLEVAAQG